MEDKITNINHSSGSKIVLYGDHQEKFLYEEVEFRYKKNYLCFYSLYHNVTSNTSDIYVSLIDMNKADIIMNYNGLEYNYSLDNETGKITLTSNFTENEQEFILDFFNMFAIKIDINKEIKNELRGVSRK